MTEDELVNKLRTNTPLGRFTCGEVRHVLEYMRSVGFELAVKIRPLNSPTVLAKGSSITKGRAE